MTNIDAKLAGRSQSHKSIQVGTVHVDHTAGSMDLCAQVDDFRLEDSIGGWIGYHDGSDLGAMLLNLSINIIHVDIAVWQTVNWHDSETTDGGSGGVCAVG